MADPLSRIDPVVAAILFGIVAAAAFIGGSLYLGHGRMTHMPFEVVLAIAFGVCNGVVLWLGRRARRQG